MRVVQEPGLSVAELPGQERESNADMSDAGNGSNYRPGFCKERTRAFEDVSFVSAMLKHSGKHHIGEPLLGKRVAPIERRNIPDEDAAPTTCCPGPGDRVDLVAHSRAF